MKAVASLSLKNLIQTKFVFTSALQWKGISSKSCYVWTKIQDVHRLRTGCDILGRLPQRCPDLGLLTVLLSRFSSPVEGSSRAGTYFLYLHSPGAIMVLSMEWVLNKYLLNEWTNQDSCYLLLYSHQDCHINRKIMGWKNLLLVLKNFTILALVKHLQIPPSSLETENIKDFKVFLDPCINYGFFFREV